MEGKLEELTVRVVTESCCARSPPEATGQSQAGTRAFPVPSPAPAALERPHLAGGNKPERNCVSGGGRFIEGEVFPLCFIQNKRGREHAPAPTAACGAPWETSG